MSNITKLVLLLLTRLVDTHALKASDASRPNILLAIASMQPSRNPKVN